MGTSARKARPARAAKEEIRDMQTAIRVLAGCSPSSHQEALAGGASSPPLEVIIRREVGGRGIKGGVCFPGFGGESRKVLLKIACGVEQWGAPTLPRFGKGISGNSIGHQPPPPTPHPHPSSILKG